MRAFLVLAFLGAASAAVLPNYFYSGGSSQSGSGSGSSSSEEYDGSHGLVQMNGALAANNVGYAASIEEAVASHEAQRRSDIAKQRSLEAEVIAEQEKLKAISEEHEQKYGKHLASSAQSRAFGSQTYNSQGSQSFSQSGSSSASGENAYNAAQENLQLQQQQAIVNQQIALAKAQGAQAAGYQYTEVPQAAYIQQQQQFQQQKQINNNNYFVSQQQQQPAGFSSSYSGYTSPAIPVLVYKFTPIQYGVGYTAPQMYTTTTSQQATSSSASGSASGEQQSYAVNKQQFQQGQQQYQEQQQYQQIDAEQARFQAIQAHQKAVEEHQAAYNAALKTHFDAIQAASAAAAAQKTSYSGIQQQGSSSASSSSSSSSSGESYTQGGQKTTSYYQQNQQPQQLFSYSYNVPSVSVSNEQYTYQPVQTYQTQQQQQEYSAPAISSQFYAKDQTNYQTVQQKQVYPQVTKEETELLHADAIAKQNELIDLQQKMLAAFKVGQTYGPSSSGTEEKAADDAQQAYDKQEEAKYLEAEQSLLRSQQQEVEAQNAEAQAQGAYALQQGAKKFFKSEGSSGSTSYSQSGSSSHSGSSEAGTTGYQQVQYSQLPAFSQQNTGASISSSYSASSSASGEQYGQQQKTQSYPLLTKEEAEYLHRDAIAKQNEIIAQHEAFVKQQQAALAQQTAYQQTQQNNFIRNYNAGGAASSSSSGSSSASSSQENYGGQTSGAFTQTQQYQQGGFKVTGPYEITQLPAVQMHNQQIPSYQQKQQKVVVTKTLINTTPQLDLKSLSGSSSQSHSASSSAEYSAANQGGSSAVYVQQNQQQNTSPYFIGIFKLAENGNLQLQDDNTGSYIDSKSGEYVVPAYYVPQQNPQLAYTQTANNYVYNRYATPSFYAPVLAQAAAA